MLGQGPPTELIGTRGHGLLKGEACRLGQGHPTPELVAAGRRFVRIEEFLAARCPCCSALGANTRRRLHDYDIDRCADELAPALGARALPHRSADVRTPPSGKRSPLPR